MGLELQKNPQGSEDLKVGHLLPQTILNFLQNIHFIGICEFSTIKCVEGLRSVHPEADTPPDTSDRSPLRYISQFATYNFSNSDINYY